jgi:DNA-binding protein HU-beta
MPKTSVESAKQAWSGRAESSNCSTGEGRNIPRHRFIEEGLMATKPATTVTLKHLAASLAEDNEISKKQSETILGGFVGQIVKHLKKGERIRIGGLGILQVRKRAARMGRNPATGEPIQIKASKKVAFRASKELKEAI